MDEGRRLMLELLGELKAEREKAERAEAALRTLVGAVSPVLSGAWGSWAEIKAGQALEKALEQARAALPGGDAED